MPAGVLLVIALVALPLGASRSYFAPYDAVGSEIVLFEGDPIQNSIIIDISQQAGRVGLETKNYNLGYTIGYGFVGKNYHVNDGSTLPATFSASVTAKYRVQGLLVCSTLSDPDLIAGQSSMTAFLDLWKPIPGGWTRAAHAQTDHWECQTPQRGIDTGTLTRSTTFTFSRNTDYAVSLGAQAASRNGNACGIPCRVSGAHFLPVFGGADRGVFLEELQVPNQAPHPKVFFVENWLVTNLVSGTTISGRACDFDGTTREIELTAQGPQLDGLAPVLETVRKKISGSDVCYDLAYNTKFLTPSFGQGHTTSAWAKDNEGGTRTSGGHARITILPGLIGPPPLTRSIGPEVVVDAVISETGEIRGIRVADTDVWRDDLAVLEPRLGDHSARVVYNQMAEVASVTLDGTVVWSGGVRQVGPDWFDLEPLDLGAAAQGASETLETLVA